MEAPAAAAAATRFSAEVEEEEDRDLDGEADPLDPTLRSLALRSSGVLRPPSPVKPPRAPSLIGDPDISKRTKVYFLLNLNNSVGGIVDFLDWIQGVSPGFRDVIVKLQMAQRHHRAARQSTKKKKKKKKRRSFLCFRSFR